MLTRWLFGIAVSFLMWFVPLVVVGQEIVTSRSESNNGLWGDGAPYPWYWDGVNQERGDPDNNATVANDILIGHNSNLSMTLNTRNYWARSLTFQSSATSPRTFGGNVLEMHPNGGSCKIENESPAQHTFNNNIALFDLTQINPVNGDLTFNGNIFNNGFFIDVYGNNGNTLTLNGLIQGTGGLAVKQSSTVILAGDQTYTGGTFVEAGVLRLEGAAGTNTITGEIDVSGGTLEYNTNDNQIDNTSNLTITSGTIDFAAREETINSLTVAGGNVERGGAALTMNAPASFTGGTITFSSVNSRFNLTGNTTFGAATFEFTGSTSPNIAIDAFGDFVTDGDGTTSFVISGGGSPGINLNNAIRTFNVIIGTTLQMGWRLRSTAPSQGGINKTGEGIMSINHTTEYTGPTQVSEGILQLGAADVMDNASSLELNGGTFSSGESSGFSETMGTLNLQGNSTLALGSGSHNINFATSNGVAWNPGATLTITGWSGDLGQAGTAGRIFVGSDASSLTQEQMNQIEFDGQGFAYLLPTGELVPRNPSFTVSESYLLPFSTPQGTPSEAFSFEVSGGSLSTDVTITAPVGFELALNEVGPYASPSLTIPVTDLAGDLASTEVFLRLTGSAQGEFLGDVTVSTSGLTDETVAVSGRVLTPGSAIIRFDDGNWTPGSSVLETYELDHEYTEQDWLFTGGNARRFSAGDQDSFPGAYGAYSWGLDEDAVTWTGTFTNSGTINAFGFKVRRWDDDPSPDYEVAYSTNGGSSFTPAVETINNTFLNNSSQWVVFEHELGAPLSIGANEFVVRLTQTTGERIFIDDFSFDITADNCANETWYYRSVSSGSYTNKLTWEKSPDGSTSWEPADCPPSENAAEVLVRDGHNVLVNTDISIPTLIIEGNALLRIDAGTLDITAGSVTINSNGVLEFDGGEVPVFPASGIGITVDGTLRVSTAVSGISSELAGNGSSGDVEYQDNSIFEWNTNVVFSSAGQDYFPDVDASTIPIFSIPQATGIVGAGANTVINGVLQVDGSMTWDNSGEKIIRNGITGNGTITQSDSSGLIRLTAPNAELNGSGTLALNSNGLLIPAGVTVDLQSDKPVVNASGESGQIEIEGVLNDNGFGMPGDVDNVIIGSTAVINCTNPNGFVATNGTFGNTAGTYSIDPNSLIDYQRSGDQDVTTVSDYGNLTIRGSGTKTISSGTTSITGDLLLDNSVVISAVSGAELGFANDMTISSTASFGDGAYDNLTLSTSNENIQNINGNANPIRCQRFFSAKGNGSLTFNDVNAVEVKDEWDTDYYTNGDFTNNGATLRVGGDMRIRGGDLDRYSVTGTVRLTGETGAAQVFRGTGDSPVSAVIENLIVGGSGSPNVDLASSGDYTFTGNITIENGQLNAFGNLINLAGNWTNYGEAGFNEDFARLFLNGVSDQTITCPGGEVFSSLTAENNTGHIVLNNNLNITGTGSEIIDLNGGAIIDLGGNRLSFSGNNGGSTGTVLRVSDSSVLITGVAGSIFEVINGWKQVESQSSGELEFDENVAVNAKSGIDFAPGGVSTIKGTLEIDAGGFVLTNPPIYFTGSTLRYQSGGDYNRNAEWNSLIGEGLPYHIDITNSTYVFMSNEPIPAPGRLEIAGDLTIDAGKLYMGNNLTNGLDVKGSVSIAGTEPDSLYLGDNIGGDIRIGEDLVVSGSGVLFQNSREVEMNGTGNVQNITGVDSFDYLAINNSGGTVIIDQETTIIQRLRLTNGTLNNSVNDIVMGDGSLILRTAATATVTGEPTVTGGDQFNIEYRENSFSTGNEFPTANTAVANVTVDGPITATLSGDRTFNGDLVLNASIIDLNGNVFTARGNAPTGTFAGNILIDGGGARTIQNSAVTQAFFDITGTGGIASEFYTKQVESLNATSLVFEDNITVRLGNGGVDFGNGNPTTIEGILQISAGGFVINNSCHYADNSILRFANGFSYNVDAIDKTWDNGDIASGNPGIPYNVESSGDNTTILTLNSPRSLRKNLNIDGSQFTLTSNSGTFEIGGNWSRSGGTSEFNHNNQEVIFNGSAAQTITTTVGVASEVFYKLTFSGDGLKTLNEDVTVEDDITINGTGGLDLNAQTIFLFGDWINAAGEATFAESGRVELIGNEGQAIMCSGGEKFDTLRVNNTSELGEGIDLFDPISVSGELIMDQGLVHNDGAQDLTLTETASTNGGDHRSYATGKIVKQGFATTDLVEFPVGYYNLNGGDTISVWQKAGLTPETADATEFSVQYFHENAVPGTSYPSNPPEALSPLITASTCNYWDIDRISGTSDAKVRLHWNDSTTCFDIGDPSFLDVSHLNNSDQWESVGVESFSSNSPFDEGFVESLLTGSFSPFTIGTSNGINVLPIQLLSFDARSFDNSQVMLEWVTATETNNDFFTLERSRDGQFFQQIGTVDGAGNSTQELNYSFVDDDPYSGISYYRLKQTDFDGAFTFSNLRAVQIIADDNFDLENVYAAEDGLRLIYLSENQFLTVEIYDLAGKRVHQQRIENRGNSLIYPNLARGVYLIRLSNRNEMVTRKFFY